MTIPKKPFSPEKQRGVNGEGDSKTPKYVIFQLLEERPTEGRWVG